MNVNVRTFPRVFEINTDNFNNELNALLDSLLATRVEKNDSQPSVSGTQTTNAYFLEIKLPGVTKKNVEIRLEGGNLNIQSIPDRAGDGTEKRAEVLFSTSGGKIINFGEAKKTPFRKIYRLPKDADPQGISASFFDGVLSLKISKKAVS